MTNLLQGKKGIIFGALDEHSIAWKTAEICYHEGASLVLTNAPIALRMGKINELSKQCDNAPVVSADVTSDEDIAKLFSESTNHFGGKIDFILHSVGMSVNIRKGKHYTDLEYDYTRKTLDISALSLHRVLKYAYHTNAIADWGSVVALSYIAAQRVFPDYNEMADAKSLLESIVRSFGYHYGVKNRVRVNAISQSPTVTTAGSGIKGFDAFLGFAKQMSPLGNASAEDCARYCATLFSDYTRLVTMQTLYHDGGFSQTGVTQEVVERFVTESSS